MSKYLRSSKLPLLLRLLLATLLFSTGAVMAVIAVTGNSPQQPPTAGQITTVVGGPGFGPATEVSMWINEIAVRNGVLYITDVGGFIRGVDLADGMATVAFGYDVGIPPTDGTTVNSGPFVGSSLTFDGAGNLYTTSTGSIRKVDLVPGSPTYGILSTVAGNGENCDKSDAERPIPSCLRGDGGPATKAKLGGAGGLNFDAIGNLYFADSLNNRVRKVDRSGIITTVAGSGPGYNPANQACFADGAPVPVGDGGPAIAAQLCNPSDLALDPAGNIYIADTNNHRVRKVDVTTGIITTVAGSGFTGVWTGEPYNSPSRCGFSGDGGSAILAEMCQPQNVTFDAAGNLLISDGGSRVRKVDSSGTITTVIGDGTFSVRKVVRDGGNFYIASGRQVRKVDSRGIITIVAGSGTRQPKFGGDGRQATSAQFDFLDGTAFDADGNLYIADKFNNRVRKVDRQGVVSTVAGNGITGGGAGNCTNVYNCFSGDGGPAIDAQLSYPGNVAVDAEGNLYIADQGSNHVRKVDRFGIITTVAGNGRTDFSGDGGPATQAGLSLLDNVLFLNGLALDSAGNLYISDTGHNRVRKVDKASGIITTVAGNGVSSPSGERSGGFSGDGGPATAAQLDAPNGLACDAAGNLFIADTFNSRVRKVDATTGTITTVAGSEWYDPSCNCYVARGGRGDGGSATDAQLNRPRDIALDGAGNLYIADGRVRKVDAALSSDGTHHISAVAGQGNPPYVDGRIGDGGPAIVAKVDGAALSLDVEGNLYISGPSHRRVRRVAQVAPPSPWPIQAAPWPSPPQLPPCNAPQIVDPTGDAPNKYSGGDGANLDNLDVVSTSFETAPGRDAEHKVLTVTVTIRNLAPPPPPANLTAGRWRVHWYYHGTTNFADVTSDPGTGGGTTFKYRYGFFKYGVPTYASTSDGAAIAETTGEFNPGANGTIKINVPLAATGNPVPGDTLTSPYVETNAGTTVNGQGSFYPEPADSNDSYGADHVVGCSGTASPGATPPPALRPLILYRQLDNGGATGSTGSKSPNGGERQLADDFVVPAGETWSISSVYVQGFYLQGTKTPPDPVNVFFYQNSGSLPGQPVSTRPVPISTITGWETGRFSIPLDPPLRLGAGTYWISVQPNMKESEAGWAWSDSLPPARNNPAVYRSPGSLTCGDWSPKGNCAVGGGPDQLFLLNGFKVSPVGLIGVVSRKVHGSAGPFDISMPLTGNPGIECRRVGANGDHKLVFTFANTVSVSGTPDKARVTSGTGTVSNVTVNGAEVTVDLTGVTNAQKITLTLFNVSDGTNTGDVSVPMGVLFGDVNATGAVDGNDVSAVQGQTRRPVNLSTFRYDVNGTGRIDGNDVSTTQSQTRTRLP